YWTARLAREQPNLRDALEYSLAENTEHAVEAGLRTATALFMFWTFRGLYGEGRRWIERLLDHPAHQSVPDRVKALHAGCVLAALQGDLPAAAALAEQAHLLAEQDPSPLTQALIAYADGAVALYRGELGQASSYLEHAIELFGSNRQGFLYAAALSVLGSVHALAGKTEQAIECQQKLLSITEACGESLFRSTALWGLGISAWQQGERSRAIELLKKALRVNRQMRSPLVAAVSLEVLSWILSTDGEAERAAILMGAAEELQRSVGNPVTVFPMVDNHDECVRTTRSSLGARGFDLAVRKGRAMGMDEAVAFALGEQPTDTTPRTGPRVDLTMRERQVADLVAEGLTNKQIAAKLVISPRTAQGHVEHILTKLGFTSRAQIAAWIAEDADRQTR
ncbi:LuxR C-terminal-related transcriptional regulator, partial [Streptomyces sp. NPDC059071]|uniref:LuxR C-terminal-related transcriptional regulator n=1 Tax=Streptomyces sp. NPDC059071 TaxID=3346714 RepID=UPI0036AA4A0E